MTKRAGKSSPTLGKRRAYGQHFLRDKSVAGRIADAAVSEAARAGCETLLEIGPGKGAITVPIIEKLGQASPTRRFIICERDRELASYWREQQGTITLLEKIDFQVEEADFNDLPEERWLSRTPLAVASNLPYSAGTAIATRLARHPGKIAVMVLMFQAEVAKRLRAERGTKDWGSLSVWIQNRWDVNKLISVPPGAFSPPPQVDSEVVVLLPRAEPRIQTGTDPEDLALWESLLRVSFAHRRKMLRSGLPPSGIWRKALEASGLDGTKRAETLDWSEWQKLFDAARNLS